MGYADEEIEEGMLVEDEEEEEGQQQDHYNAAVKAYDALKESKASIKDLVSQLLAIKTQQSKPKSQLPELATQMFLNFVSLRQANRSILLEEDSVKAETERAKAPVDFTTLQLHNLMYEKSHYVKAIKACKDFKSKYPNIDLVPEDEFFRGAPEDIKGQTLSTDSAHDLMLKRLNYELLQRKELCKLRENLEEQKKSLMGKIANRKKFLSSLPSHLKSLKKASLPVQNQLGVLHTKKLKQHQLAELLPPPLYVVYSQLMAQKEAFGEDIDVEIVGSVKDAQTFARQQAIRDAGLSTNVESSRLDDDVPDEEDDGQRKRRRPKKAPGKESPDQAGVYQLHPLKIFLHIYDDEALDPKSARLVTLKLEYLLKLNCVCVGIEGSQDGPDSNMLCNLFPDDTGLELPHQSAKLIVGDGFLFDKKRTSRPFKWAQHLAGIDFLPEVSPLLTVHDTSVSETAKTDAVTSGLSLYRQQNRVETVVQKIRARKKAQLALVEQLDSLVKLKWPPLTCENVPWASHAPSCKLDSWADVGPLHIQQHKQLPGLDTEQPLEPMIIDMDGKSGISHEELETVREDGELPSLVSVASAANDVKDTPTRGPNFEHSRQLALISKSAISPVNMSKSHSFKKREEKSDLMLDVDSDIEDPTHNEPDADDVAFLQWHLKAENVWVDFGAREYDLVLSKKVDTNKKNVRLEAKIKISMEYPLRPPFFVLSMCNTTHEGNISEESPEWYNQLRAMEAEVNLHILKMIPVDQENYVLAHQVQCLAMLFDYYMDEASTSSEKRKSTSVFDIGLSKPVSGSILARSFRGRDRRKMISLKDGQCASMYPY